MMLKARRSLSRRNNNTGTGMSNAAHQSTDDRVATIVSRLLGARLPSREIARDEALTDVGLISLDMVNLMLEIESNFNVRVPSRMVTPRNFKSIESIARMLDALNVAA
jgi:acyl carrier protein